MSSIDEKKKNISDFCNQIMHSTLKSALESHTPDKVVDFTKIGRVEGCECTGYLMLFFVKYPVSGESGVLSQAAGGLSVKCQLMLFKFYPQIFANLYGGRV